MTANEIYLQELIKAKVKQILKEEEAEPVDPKDVDPEIEDELEDILGDAAKEFARDMKSVAKDVEKDMQDDDKIEKVLKDNPDIEKLAQESVRRRRGGKLNEKQALNEEFLSVTFLVGLSLAIPSIVSLIGSVVKMIEKKLGSKTEMGDKLKHIGHEMHEGIIKFIQNGLKLIPGFTKLKPETQRKIATVVHIVVVAYLAIHSGGVALESVKAGLQAANISVATVEGALAAVKSGEVGGFIKEVIVDIVGA